MSKYSILTSHYSKQWNETFSTLAGANSPDLPISAKTWLPKVCLFFWRSILQRLRFLWVLILVFTSKKLFPDNRKSRFLIHLFLLTSGLNSFWESWCKACPLLDFSRFCWYRWSGKELLSTCLTNRYYTFLMYCHYFWFCHLHSNRQ